MFDHDYGIEDQFLSIIVQSFSYMFDFTGMDTLTVNYLPYLCNMLPGPFESRFSTSGMCEIFFCVCTRDL